jgi:phosphate-selective porin
MTETDQHQQPLQHAIDRAKNAISKAKEARWALEQAYVAADPHQLQGAQARLAEAEREVAGATQQLEQHATESQYQQIAQTLTQLRQATQDNEMTAQSVTTPKQIR